jgi:hypothetical protein
MNSGRNIGLDGNGMARTKQYLARCSCGSVKLTASGRPIVASVCYCDDCQAAARQIATLAGLSNVADPDGGTEYLLFRKDRLSCSDGSQHLRQVRLKDTSATRRMIASCCESAMYMAFDDVRHWVSAYRARFVGDVPPLEMRICTKSRTSNEALDSSIPSYAGYPLSLMVRLLGSMLPTLFTRKQKNPSWP